jgi:phosphomevalonate kinase
VIARAPGKLLLSGSYVVLDGAPALVTAVDRFVTADAGRAATRCTDEVRAALDAGVAPGAAAPWFEASALRAVAPGGSDRKLGLGSSAAILAASLGALLPPQAGEDEAAWRARLYPLALEAHRRAQGGGSGVDVAASVLGGTLCCLVAAAGLEARAHALPGGVHVEVFAHPASASTTELLRALRALRATDPARTEAALRAAAEGARAAASATDAAALVAGIDAQQLALATLAPEVPVVLPEVVELRRRALGEGATFAPSGAGGGDVSVFVGAAPSSPSLRGAAEAAGLVRLDVAIGARGLHLISVGG